MRTAHALSFEFGMEYFENCMRTSGRVKKGAAPNAVYGAKKSVAPVIRKRRYRDMIAMAIMSRDGQAACAVRTLRSLGPSLHWDDGSIFFLR